MMFTVSKNWSVSKWFELGISCMNEVALNNRYCRRAEDRRKSRLLSLVYGLYRSRRAGDRRTQVATPSYIDIHSHCAWALALSIMALCIADVYFTLLLIEHGSRELNPLLAWALEKDAMLFYTLKYTITALSVFLIVQHRHFIVFGIKGYNFLFIVLAGYVMLITYQLSMLVHIV